LYLNGVLLRSLSNNIVEADGTNAGYITFNSLETSNNANVVPAGVTRVLEVKATFTSSFTLGTNVFTTEIVSGTTSITAKSVTGNKDVLETVVSATTNSRQITLASVGDLSVELKITGTKADSNRYVLAGSQTPAGKYMGELVFTTQNEPIKVTELRLADGGSATSGDVKEVKLVDGAGVVKATKAPAANGDVVFDPLNLVFPADQATSLYIVAVFNGMNVDGDPSSTSTYGHVLQYHINATSGVVAQGDESGIDTGIVLDANGTLVMGEWSEAAVVSKTNTVNGAVLNSITNNMADGVLTGGSQKVLGKYKFVFDNGSNRKADNTDLKAIIDNMVITVNKSSAVLVATTSAKVYIDGTTTKVTADANTCNAAGTSCSFTWNADTLQGLADGGAVDGEVTLVIVGDVTTTTAEYLSTSLADLDGSGSNDDFQYIGDGLAATAGLSNMYLPVTEVIGGTLSN